jgi:nitrous oxidase accessory protein NosD
MSKSILPAAMAALLVLSLQVQPARADSDRTFVSGTGDDNNPQCSRTAPCKTFAGAIGRTNAGGEVIVLDPGGFAAAIINKSVSFIAEGTFGGIVSGGDHGVVIDAPGANVLLHGLILDGLGTGGAGIRIVNASTVHIRKCLIKGFKQGISVELTGPTRVFVSDCAIAGNDDGVTVKTTGSGRATVILDRVQVMYSKDAGLSVDGLLSRITLNASTVTGNKVGLAFANNGQIASYKNNVVIANSTDGNPSTTINFK